MVTTWIFEPGHTEIAFRARHMMVTWVRGAFKDVHGRLEFDWATCLESSFTGWADTEKLWTGEPDRDAHLKSADFFDVDKHPTMRFASKRVERHGDDYRIVGDLTIKDVTREVELDYEHGGDLQDPFGNRKLGGSLTGTVKRSEWGLTWNVPLDSGGWLVSDNVKLEVDLQVAETTEVVAEEAKAEAEISS